MGKISFDDLSDKVCVITGGAGVIGNSLVRGLASVGVRTAIIDINREMAESLADKISKAFNVQTMGIVADVLDKDSLEQARTEIHRRMGKISLLINGAGGNSPRATTVKEVMSREDIGDLSKTFFGLQMEGFQQVFSLNFTGTVLPTMVFALDMVEEGKGTIVNISSMNAFKPLTKIPAYSAAKASINNFTQWLAVHLAPVGIRVNAIAPGFYLTQQNRYLLIDDKTGSLTSRGEKIIAGTPMGRFGETDELQGTLLYLLSDVSGFVTGIVIPVDGGFCAYGGV